MAAPAAAASADHRLHDENAVENETAVLLSRLHLERPKEPTDYLNPEAPKEAAAAPAEAPADEPLTISDEGTLAVLSLLRRRVGSNVFTTRFFDPATIDLLKKHAPKIMHADVTTSLPESFFAPIGSSPDAGHVVVDKEKLDNKEVVKHVKAFLEKREHFPLGSGYFGTTYLLHLAQSNPPSPNDAAIVIKQFRTRAKAASVEAEVRKILTTKPEVREYLRWVSDIVPYKGGYAMLAAEQRPKPWAWVQQWFRLILAGAIHGDLKPDNLAGGSTDINLRLLSKGAKMFAEAAANPASQLPQRLADKNLIDLDNAILCLGRARHMTMGHNQWYMQAQCNLHDELNALFLLSGIKHDFLVCYSTPKVLFVAVRPYVEKAKLLEMLKPITGDVQEVIVSPIEEMSLPNKEAMIAKIVCKNHHKWLPLTTDKTVKDQIVQSNEFAHNVLKLPVAQLKLVQY